MIYLPQNQDLNMLWGYTSDIHEGTQSAFRYPQLLCQYTV